MLIMKGLDFYLVFKLVFFLCYWLACIKKRWSCRSLWFFEKKCFIGYVDRMNTVYCVGLGRHLKYWTSILMFVANKRVGRKVHVFFKPPSFVCTVVRYLRIWVLLYSMYKWFKKPQKFSLWLIQKSRVNFLTGLPSDFMHRLINFVFENLFNC